MSVINITCEPVWSSQVNLRLIMLWLQLLVDGNVCWEKWNVRLRNGLLYCRDDDMPWTVSCCCWIKLTCLTWVLADTYHDDDDDDDVYTWCAQLLFQTMTSHYWSGKCVTCVCLWLVQLIHWLCVMSSMNWLLLSASTRILHSVLILTLTFSSISLL